MRLRQLIYSCGFELAAEGWITNIGKPASIYLTDGKNAGELVVKIMVDGSAYKPLFKIN